MQRIVSNTKFIADRIDDLYKVDSEVAVNKNTEESLQKDKKVPNDQNMVEIDSNTQDKITSAKLEQMKFAADAENELSYERMEFVTIRSHPYVIEEAGNHINKYYST